MHLIVLCYLVFIIFESLHLTIGLVCQNNPISWVHLSDSLRKMLVRYYILDAERIKMGKEFCGKYFEREHNCLTHLI